MRQQVHIELLVTGMTGFFALHRDKVGGIQMNSDPLILSEAAAADALE
jgi:hypothetical protein